MIAATLTTQAIISGRNIFWRVHKASLYIIDGIPRNFFVVLEQKK